MMLTPCNMCSFHDMSTNYDPSILMTFIPSMTSVASMTFVVFASCTLYYLHTFYDLCSLYKMCTLYNLLFLWPARVIGLSSLYNLWNTSIKVASISHVSSVFWKALMKWAFFMTCITFMTSISSTVWENSDICRTYELNSLFNFHIFHFFKTSIIWVFTVIYRAYFPCMIFLTWIVSITWLV